MGRNEKGDRELERGNSTRGVLLSKKIVQFLQERPPLLIETETGRITAAVNETFGSAVPASVLTDKLSKKLLEKLTKLYPLRGKISEVKGDEIRLNIGKNVGVKVGQQFKVEDTDWILEIVSVQSEVSSAKGIKGEKLPKGGQRIEAL